MQAQAEQKKANALLLCLSMETVRVVKNLGLSADEMKNSISIMNALELHIRGQVNETVARRDLRKRTQEAGETVNDFVVALRNLVTTCNFCNEECEQKAIRDQLIEGLEDGDAVEDLLKEKDLTLTQAIDLATAKESAKKGKERLKGTEVNRTNWREKGSTRKGGVNSGAGGSSKDRCRFCGRSQHSSGKTCPAKNKTCNTCGKEGHFEVMCHRDGGKKQQQQNKSGKAKLSSVKVCAAGVKKAPTVKMELSCINGKAMVSVLPDSGADISVMGVDVLKQIGEDVMNVRRDDRVESNAVNGSKMKALGYINGTFRLGKREVKDKIHVFRGVKGALMSWFAAKQMGILPESYPNPAVHAVSLNAVSGTTTKDELVKEFADVFSGEVKVMPGEKFKIHLTQDAKPFCVRAPRTIPLAYHEPVKEELELLQRQNIIAPQTKPTDRCHAMAVSLKKNGKVRLNIDFIPTNKYVKRENYYSKTPAEEVRDIAQSGARFFTSLDAIKGYHQCPLDEESQDLTTFITPFGRFKFLRAPYGICSISEHYNRRMDEAFQGLSGIRRVVDDVLIFDKDKTEHEKHVREVLQRCRDKGISLNKEKFLYAEKEVLFAGFHVSSDGYRISDAVTGAIARFPTPSSRSDLRGYFGLVNQTGNSTKELAAALEPLRALLSSKNDFLWTADHDKAFQESRETLSKAMTLVYFDLNKETRLRTDASKTGVGFVLQQKHGDVWRTVQAGSRFLSPAESRYAVIEQEMLGVTWAVAKKCKNLLKGLTHIEVVTDHNPLVPIINSHRLDEIENPRLQRLRMKLQGFNITARWEKGAANEAADALSRHPVDKPGRDDELGEREAPQVCEIRASQLGEEREDNLRLQELRQQAERDEVYQALRRLVQDGFPEKKSELAESLKPFWAVKEGLAIDDELVVYGCRLVIPHSLRASMLVRLHDAHQGVTRSQQRARLTMYWPGMEKDIENFVAGCCS